MEVDINLSLEVLHCVETPSRKKIFQNLIRNYTRAYIYLIYNITNNCDTKILQLSVDFGQLQTSGKTNEGTYLKYLLLIKAVVLYYTVTHQCDPNGNPANQDNHLNSRQLYRDILLMHPVVSTIL